MVRFEDNNLLHFLSLQSVLYFAVSFPSGNISRDGLRRSGREDHLEDTEDEVRFGVVEDRMKEFP